MKVFRALAVLGVAVAIGLAMLGSWTRINNAGMTCPDWPLCRGAVVPVLQGGVVFEWMHRLLAFIETFVVAGSILTGLRLVRVIRPLRGLLIALGAVFVLQVLLGGVTIKFANSPISVTIHWGAAMLLLTVLGSLTVLAFVSDENAGALEFSWDGTGPLVIAAVCAFATMCAGAFVSSSFAGLACPSVPGCDATFFGQTGPQLAQMTHRLLAATLAVAALAAAWLLPRSRVRATTTLRVALVLLVLQITLGVLNVILSLPTPLREAHAVNAVATFLALVVAAVFASLEAGNDAQPERVKASNLLDEDLARNTR